MHLVGAAVADWLMADGLMPCRRPAASLRPRPLPSVPA